MMPQIIHAAPALLIDTPEICVPNRILQVEAELSHP
jgi:hypothetical protein